MKKLYKKSIIFMTAVIMTITMFTVSAMASIMPPEKMSYTPHVVSSINTATQKVIVYGYPDTTLYVKCGGSKLAETKFSKAGFKTVTFKSQKAGSKIQFYLQTSYGKKGNTISRTVLNLAGEKKSTALKAPKVQKTIDNTLKAIPVSAQKNTTLIIKSDKAKILAQKVYTKNGYQNINIKIPGDTRYLYFYEKLGNKRSTITIRQVQDKTAPKAPSVTKQNADGSTIKVTGELFTRVCLNYGNGWVTEGVITDKNGVQVIPALHAESEGTLNYKVRLKDIAGNVSKTVSMSYTGDKVTVVTG